MLALPDKVRAIDTAFEAMFGDPADERAAATAHRLAHNLVGTSGTFGLFGIGQIASALAHVAQSFRKERPQRCDDARRRARGLLDQLNVAAGRAERDIETCGLSASEPDAVDYRSTVFVVEDDPGQADSLAPQLRLYGYAVRTFSGMEQVKRGLESETPAALVLDMALAEGPLAGARGLATLRRDPAFSVPALFYSVQSDISARLEAVRAGADSYFTKPRDIGAMLSRLEDLTGLSPRENFRVLLVDDDPESAAIHALILRQADMIVEVVTDPLEVQSPLSESYPDVILLDHRMPACTGTELAAVLRQVPELASVPIVFLSAETESSAQLAAKSAGAEDFLTKPIAPARLVSEVALRARRGRALRSLMTRDGHTGLLNYSAFMTQMETELARARRRGGSLSIAMMDVDHFKSVNDTHGHPAGDRVLLGLARLLQQRLRKGDVLGRYGGDEFIVLLPDTDNTDAVRALETVRASFAKIRHAAEGTSFTATLSCGVAPFPQHGETSILLKAADQALYEAKKRGRNQVAGCPVAMFNLTQTR